MKRILIFLIPIILLAFVFLIKIIFPVLKYDVRYRDPTYIIQIETSEREAGIGTILGVEGIFDQKDNHVGELIHTGIGKYMANKNIRVYPLVYVCIGIGNTDCVNWKKEPSVSLLEYDNLAHKAQCTNELGKKYCYVRNWRIILNGKNEITKLIEVK